MALGRSRLVALLGGAALIACACATSSSERAPASTQPARTSASTAASTSASTPSVSSDDTAVQTYLTTVNGLCDALLPKVIAVTHGGSLDVPVMDYLAQQPAHAKLLADFDRKLARVPVPAGARDKAAVFAAYVRFATLLDAQRLDAAHHGASAYAKEVRSEAAIESDPAITALSAAGFADSCQAR